MKLLGYGSAHPSTALKHFTIELWIMRDLIETITGSGTVDGISVRYVLNVYRLLMRVGAQWVPNKLMDVTGTVDPWCGIGKKLLKMEDGRTFEFVHSNGTAIQATGEGLKDAVVS